MTEDEKRELLHKAIVYATTMHAGQNDLAGHPYIIHVQRILHACYRYGYDAAIVAVLHDILEDTPASVFTLERLGCTDEHITAIKLLTRDRDRQSYIDYVAACTENEWARLVKKADITDHLLWAYQLSTEQRESLCPRYRNAHLYITQWELARKNERGEH